MEIRTQGLCRAAIFRRAIAAVQSQTAVCLQAVPGASAQAYRLSFVEIQPWHVCRVPQAVTMRRLPLMLAQS